MTEEHYNIKNRDWRLRCIATLAKQFIDSKTGIVNDIGTPIEEVKQIKYNNKLEFIILPDPSAMYLSLAIDLGRMGWDYIKNNFPKSLNELNTPLKKKEYEEELFNALENLIANIIFSYTAIETFANFEIPDDYKYINKRNDKSCTQIYNKEQIERYISLDIKLDIILPEILNLKSPKRSNKWSDYKWLKKLRDRLIHLKSSDWESKSKNFEDNIWTLLLNDQVNNAPFIVFKLIEHYDTKPYSKHRWIEKFKKKFKV